MSLQQLQDQRANFIAAYTQHKITKQQMETALANNQKQIDALKNQQNTTPAPSSVASPMPAEPGTSAYIAQGSFVQKGSTIVNDGGQTVGVVGDKANAPVLEPGKTYTVIAPPVVQAAPVEESKAISNDVFSGKNLNFAGQQPVVKNNEDRLTAIGAVAAVITAPAVGVGASVKAAGIGVGVAQGVKTGSTAIQGGDITQSLLTPREAVEAAAGGVLFSGVGGAANKVLGITGKGVSDAASRVATSGIIGAGGAAVVEGAKTGKVTAEGVLEGAAFGLAFGAAGEIGGAVNAKTGVTQKASGKVQDVVVKHNLKTLEGINDKYVTAYNKNEMPNFTGKEKFVMKTTGVGPLKPEPHKVFLKDIPTANPESFETYSGTKKQNVEYNQPITNQKGELIDMVPIKYTEEAPAKFIREKSNERLGFRELNEASLKKQTLSNAELIDAGTVTYGRSESPEVFYSKKTTQPVKDAFPEFQPSKNAKGEYGISEVKTDQSLSFKKTKTELFNEQQTPNVNKVLEPGKMVKGRTEAFKLAGSPKDLETPYSFSTKKGEPLSFQKPKQITSVKDLKKNINLFDKIQNEPVTAKNVKTTKSKGDYMYRETSEQQLQRATDLINRGSVSQGGKGKVTAKDSLIMEQLTGKSKGLTGQEKYVEELRLGNAVADTAKRPSVMTRGSAWTAGASGAWRQRETYEDITISYPKNSPLQSPKTISEISIRPDVRQDGGLTPINIIHVPTRNDNWPPNPLPITPEPNPVPPIVIPDIVPVIIPDVIPPGPKPVITPDIPPIVIPDITPINEVTPKPIIGSIPDIFIPTRIITDSPPPPPTRKPYTAKTLGSPFFDLPRGGGVGSGGSKRFRGAAGLRKQAIPTPKELLGQAGLGKTGFKAKSLIGTANKFYTKPHSKSGKRKR